jgi:hypothetical protein
MRTSRKLTLSLLALFALVVMSASALAADPGAVIPATSEVSDQKAGSILIFNYYNAGTGEGGNNTRINITNTSSTDAAYVHLFYLSDGCAVADNFLCLTKNQTATFEMTDVDPMMKGYIVAVAVDQETGCPVAFNHLVGDEFINADGYVANLGAEAFAALWDDKTVGGPPPLLPNCDENSPAAALRFNGQVGISGSVGYNCAPRVLAISSLAPPDTSDTRVIVNRLGGSLLTAADGIGSMFGWAFDDAENAFSFVITGGCQYDKEWVAKEPRLTPRLSTIIPPQRTGWAKFWATSAISSSNPGGRGIIGAVLVKGDADGYNGGRNLHKLTVECADGFLMPVFPPSC